MEERQSSTAKRVSPAPPTPGTVGAPARRRNPRSLVTTMSPSRRGGVTEQAADATVDQACRMLRLPMMRAQVADAAQREQLTYRGFVTWVR